MRWSRYRAGISHERRYYSQDAGCTVARPRAARSCQGTGHGGGHHHDPFDRAYAIGDAHGERSSDSRAAGAGRGASAANRCQRDPAARIASWGPALRFAEGRTQRSSGSRPEVTRCPPSPRTSLSLTAPSSSTSRCLDRSIQRRCRSANIQRLWAIPLTCRAVRSRWGLEDGHRVRRSGKALRSRPAAELRAVVHEQSLQWLPFPCQQAVERSDHVLTPKMLADLASALRLKMSITVSMRS